MNSAITEILTSWVSLRYVTPEGAEVQGMKPCDLNRSLLDRGYNSARKLTAADYVKLGFNVRTGRLVGRPNSPFLPIVTLI